MLAATFMVLSSFLSLGHSEDLADPGMTRSQIMTVQPHVRQSSVAAFPICADLSPSAVARLRMLLASEDSRQVLEERIRLAMVGALRRPDADGERNYHCEVRTTLPDLLVLACGGASCGSDFSRAHDDPFGGDLSPHNVDNPRAADGAVRGIRGSARHSS